MVTEYISKPKSVKSYKSKLYIFDLDGCIADSDNFILTNEEAYKLDPDLYKRKGVGFRGKLTDDTKRLFSEAYLADHQLEIKPYIGILDLFVRMSQVSHTAIVTSRTLALKQSTVSWLKKVISEFYGDSIYRQITYKLIFNENDEKSLIYKKNIIDQLLQTYDIVLAVEDHPEVITYLKSKKIVCLTPATGYKNLNGNDLTSLKGK